MYLMKDTISCFKSYVWMIDVDRLEVLIFSMVSKSFQF